MECSGECAGKKKKPEKVGFEQYASMPDDTAGDSAHLAL